MKPTLAINFDGVIHAYSRGWQDGVIYDDPVPGTEAALADLSGAFNIVVFTSRMELIPVWRWLQDHDLQQYIADVTNHKPIAVAYIDDRAVTFHGDWDLAASDLVETIERLKR